MDRSEKLLECAKRWVEFGAHPEYGYSRELVAAAMRSDLFMLAIELGFDPKTEAAARVDEALSKAGTTH